MDKGFLKELQWRDKNRVFWRKKKAKGKRKKEEGERGGWLKG
jgi:hypothetical protein